MKGNVNRREELALKKFAEKKMDIDISNIDSMSWDYMKSNFIFKIDKGDRYETIVLEDVVSDKIFLTSSRMVMIWDMLRENYNGDNYSFDEFIEDIDKHDKEHNIYKELL